jgi:hypothetical protein
VTFFRAFHERSMSAASTQSLRLRHPQDRTIYAQSTKAHRNSLDWIDNRRRRLRAIVQVVYSTLRGAIGAAVEGLLRFHPMPDHFTPPVGTPRGHGMDRTLKTVKSVGLSSDCDRKGFVVLMSTGFTTYQSRSPFRQTAFTLRANLCPYRLGLPGSDTPSNVFAAKG